MGRITLSSLEATHSFAAALAPLLKPHAILALSGDLGSGKTTFVQGLASALHIPPPIPSPTFTYLNLYPGLYHFDLYRLKTPSDFLALGFEEYFDKEGICAIEWPERISSLLPTTAIHLFFAHHPEGRTIAFEEIPSHLLQFFESYGSSQSRDLRLP